MNIKQKICLWVGIAAIVVMGLFPPWVLECKDVNIVGSWEGRRYEYKYTTEPGPYSWIGKPPETTHKKKFFLGGETSYNVEIRAKFVDLYRLGVQFFIVGVATAGLMIILGEKKGKNKSSIENKSPMTLRRGLFIFTLVSSIALGFIAPTIIIGFFIASEGWDEDMAGWWIVGLFFFAGIWILYSIIRLVIIPISRWVAKRFRDV